MDTGLLAGVYATAVSAARLTDPGGAIDCGMVGAVAGVASAALAVVAIVVAVADRPLAGQASRAPAGWRLGSVPAGLRPAGTAGRPADQRRRRRHHHPRPRSCNTTPASAGQRRGDATVGQPARRHPWPRCPAGPPPCAGSRGPFGRHTRAGASPLGLARVVRHVGAVEDEVTPTGPGLQECSFRTAQQGAGDQPVKVRSGQAAR
jgi:hypothetical protein